ncbi:MAG: hypothetical protein O9297_06115 [Flavobacterium sp.]|uniref:hypothetical protein n=1 Tax=Flavobacterium sp. TaxID=239 RepID=UPI0022BD5608|nr:hypothetical protein [Flavobacterium sp.]MCZ8296775.1 hypothetical protein [Flavobacterium sp.]
MKKAILIFTASFFIISCTSTRFDYKYQMTKPNVNKELVYSDSKIDITINVKDSYVDLKIKNLSDRPLKIIWDEASFVKNGEAQKIIHKNVKFIDKEKNQAPTVVPVNSFVLEMVQPIDDIKLQTSTYVWSTKPFFKQYGGVSSPKYVDHFLRPLIGSKIGLYLPIEYNGEKLEYLFELEVKDIWLEKGKKSKSLIY